MRHSELDAASARAVAAFGAAITSTSLMLRAEHLVVAVTNLTHAAANEADKRRADAAADETAALDAIAWCFELLCNEVYALKGKVAALEEVTHG